MKNHTTTIKKLVGNVNIKGGFWLPNIQRDFVWKPGQIEMLFDSLMRGYPIGTLLIWKTDGNIKHRKFTNDIGSMEPEGDPPVELRRENGAWNARASYKLSHAR